jgi:uncharacterized DUF497 family protein
MMDFEWDPEKAVTNLRKHRVSVQNVKFMKKQISNAGPKDELRPEYDLKALLKGGVRGKYAARYKAGTNIVRLAPDVAKVFPTEESVNQALRLVIELGQLQKSRKVTRVTT